MPLHAMMGHRLTQKNWTYRGNTVALADENQVFARLRELQVARRARMATLRFCPSGGILKAELRYVFAVRESLRYVECCGINDDKTPAFFLNAVIGFSVAKTGRKGVALMSYAGIEMHATCRFLQHDAVLAVDTPNGKFECRWSEGYGRSGFDTGRVVAVDDPADTEVYSIRGQSAEQERNGKVLKHEIFSGEHSLGVIYPEGSWRGGPKTFIDRWFFNRIALLEYKAELPRILGHAGSKSWDAFFVGLSGSLTLPRPLSPFFNS